MLDDEFYVAPPAQVSLDSHEIAFLSCKERTGKVLSHLGEVEYIAV